MAETIDRYEILQKLAAGGMAELFLAKQSGMEGFEKVVVIKRILTHLATDQEFVSMFLDEARIAAKLSHPNVVQIYDLGRADDTYYIAMEYVSGRNVAAVIKKAKDTAKTLPVEHVARIVSGVCDGLFYAHTRKDYDGKPLNIIHRDISPQNILVSFAGGVKLVDFGIAKASTQLAQTRAGVLKGKYSYMSPEQVRGDKIDGRSDLFAVGIVMYEMLTGQRPFERDSSLKTLKAIVQEKPINPRELNPNVPPEIVKILSKALEKDPNRRYNNAQEMQMAMEDWLDRSPNKSNNVRISRYLYDLFDDELNSEGGTLEVAGIGEIIIPTGTHDVVQPDPGADEIPESTLLAALADVKDPKAAQKAAEAKGATPPPAAPAKAAPPRPNTPPPKAAARPAAPPPRPNAVATDPGVVLDDDDAVDHGESDATIPVYDLKQYEEERLRRHAEETGVNKRPNLPAARDRSARDVQPSSEARTGPALNLDMGESSDFDEAPTRNLEGLVLQAKLAQSRLGAAADNAVGVSPGGGAVARNGSPPRGGVNGSAALDANITAEESAPALPKAGRPPPPRPVPTPAPKPPPPALADDEIIPGLAPPGVRPAADIKPPAAVRPAADARPVADGVRPVAETRRPAAEVAAPPAAEGSGSSRLPPLKNGSSAALPPVVKERPAVKPEAVVIAPVPQLGQPPVQDPPPAPPKASKKPLNKGVLIIAGSAVFALVVSVFVVKSILDTGEAPAASAPVDDVDATGKIKVQTDPKGCEIWVDGIQQNVQAPTVLGGLKLDKPITIMVTKEGYKEVRETVTLTKADSRRDLDFKLEKKK